MLRTNTSSCDAQEAAGWVGGSLYNVLMIHGQDLSRGLSSAEVDGMETGSPCRVFGHIMEYPIAALVPSFVRGFNRSTHLISSLLPSPSPVLRLYLAASLRSTRLCNSTYPFRFLSAGRPQPGHALWFFAPLTVLILVSQSVYGHYLPLTCPQPSLCGAIAY